MEEEKQNIEEKSILNVEEKNEACKENKYHSTTHFGDLEFQKHKHKDPVIPQPETICFSGLTMDEFRPI